MPGLSDLPAELHHLIGLHVFNPFVVTLKDRLSGHGVFNKLESYRKADLYYLMSFASTCRAIRHAVEPIAFRYVTLRSMDDVRGARESHWAQYVKILQLRLDEFQCPQDEFYIEEGCDELLELLQTLSGLQHWYISASAREARMLALLSDRLVFRQLSGSTFPPDTAPHLSRMISFAVDCSPERHNTKIILAALEQLLPRLPGLEFLFIKSYNEVERTRSRPRLLPFLTHIKATPRVLHISGCWQERDDDLLSRLSSHFRKLTELFIFHGCDHDNHGQWKDNAVSRLQAYPNLRLIVWEVEAFWQAIEAQLNPLKEETLTRQLASALPCLDFVGFSRYNHYEPMMGVRRHDGQIALNAHTVWGQMQL